MRLYYKKNKLEDTFNKEIIVLINKINNNKQLIKFIYSLGIVGPCSRGEGFYFNDKIKSDIDLYIITNKISFKLNNIIRKLIKNTFSAKLDVSALIVYKSIFNKPDLMFFEYANSGKVLFGNKIKSISLNKIAKFEGFRNIIYRGAYFLSLFNVKNNQLILKNIEKEFFLYYYSKVIFAIGEIKLLINEKYVASNFERNKLIKKYHDSLSFEHELMHRFRYFHEIPEDFNFEKYIKKAFSFIEQGFDMLFDRIISLRNIKRVHPNLITRIVNKIIFIKEYYVKYRKLELNLEEDFIKLILMYYNFVVKFNQHKKITKYELDKILNYWKTAGWFVIKI